MTRFALLLALLCAVAPAQAMMPVTYNSTVLFTGNCLPCLEDTFRHLGGVVQVNKGFVNAPHKIPVIRVLYDHRIVSYGRVLQKFWGSVTAADASRKEATCFKGKGYAAGIFTLTSPQTEQAKRLLDREAEDNNIHLPVFIKPAPVFYFDSQKEKARKVPANCKK